MAWYRKTSKRGPSASSTTTDGSFASKHGDLGQLSMMLPLEPRFMFDAAVAAAAADIVADADGALADPADDGGSGAAESEANDFAAAADLVRDTPDAPSSGYDQPNESPVINGGDTDYTVNEDERIALVTVTNPITLDDPEGDTLVLTLEAENGTMFITAPDGATIDSNASVGNPIDGYSKLVIIGDQTNLNAALDSLAFQGHKDWNGDAFVHMHVLELDPAFSVWHDAAEKTLTIHVTPVNDVPTIVHDSSTPLQFTVLEDEVLDFGSSENLFTLYDPDDGDQITVTFGVSNGTLSFADPSFTPGPGGVYTFTGTMDQINELIAGMTYRGEQDYFGQDVLKITARDSEGELQSWDALIQVTPVNDAPYLVGTDEPVVVDEGGYTILTEDHLNLGDVDSTDNQLMITVTAPPDATMGVLQKLRGSTWIDVGTEAFSYQELLDGKIRYLHLGGQVRDSVNPGSERDSFKVTVSDGFLNVVTPDNNNITINIEMNAVNQAPKIHVVGDGDSRVELVYEDPVTGDKTYQHVVYEGERGAVIRFDIEDPDQDPSTPHSVKVTNLPADGTLFYDAGDGLGFVEVTEGMVLSMARIDAGCLRYDHNGRDGAQLNYPGYFPDSPTNLPRGGTRPDGFRVEVTDDGGGAGGGEAITVEREFTIRIHASNDLPVVDEYVGSHSGIDSNGNPVTVDDVLGVVDVGVWNKDIVITNDILRVSDVDSSDAVLTYTVQEGFKDHNGALYYRTQEGVDANGKPQYAYRELVQGSFFTQADVNAGRIVYCFYGGFNTTDVNGDGVHDDGGYRGIDSIKLTIRDGSKSVVDADGNVHLPNGFEGGVGEWIDGEWTLTTFSLVVDVNFEATGGPAVIPPRPTIGDKEIVLEGDKDLAVYEGGQVTVTSDDLNTYITYEVKMEGEETVWEVDNDPNLRYRVESRFTQGYLFLREYEVDADGNALRDANGNVIFTGTVTQLGTLSTFHQRDIDAGALYYEHNGHEPRTGANGGPGDVMTLSISNGTIEYSGAIRVNMDIKPVNDTPEVKGDEEKPVIVKEGPEIGAGGQTGSSFDDFGTVLTPEHIILYDDDGTGYTTEGGYNSTNDLTFVIVGKPAYGRILVYSGSGDPNDPANWHEAVYADPEPASGDPNWRSNVNWSGLTNAAGKTVTVLSQQDLIDGHIRYVHDGRDNVHDPASPEVQENFPGASEGSFRDEIRIVVNDNKGIDASNAAVTSDDGHGNTISGWHGGSISAVGVIEVQITPVNDSPYLLHNTAVTVTGGDRSSQDPNTFTPEQIAGMVVGIGNGDTSAEQFANGRLQFWDWDNTSDQLQYQIVDGGTTQNGTLYRYVGGEWRALGVGSVFSQADINAGHIIYVHNGSENHVDSFKFLISDGDTNALVDESDPSKGYIHTYNINIEMVNDTPTITETDVGKSSDGKYYLDRANGADLSGVFVIDDPDYAASPEGSGITRDEMEITISARDRHNSGWGYLVVSDAALAGLVDYDGIGTSEITLRGSRDALNAALAALMFKPELDGESKPIDLNDTVTLSLHLNDLANGDKNLDQANARTADASIDIFVSPENSAPVFSEDPSGWPTTDGAALVMNEDATIYVTQNGQQGGTPISIFDADEFNRNINEITLTVENGILSVGTSGVSIIGGANNSKTITLRGTNANLNRVLETLRYKPNGQWSGDDNLHIKYIDGNSVEWGTGDHSAKWCETDIAIRVLPLNDAPIIEAPAAPVVIGTDKAYDVAVDGQPVRIDDPNDLDSPGYNWTDILEVTLTVTRDDTTATFGYLDFKDGADWDGVTVTGGGVGQSSITLRGNRDAINALLASLTYEVEQGTDEDLTVTLTIDVRDFGNGSAHTVLQPGDPGYYDPNDLDDSRNIVDEKWATTTVSIIVNDANNPPDVYYPGAADNRGTATVNEDTDLVFSSGNGNAITVVDPDAGDYRITVTLTVEHGTLTLGNTGHFQIHDRFDHLEISDDGRTITIFASQAKINQALEGLVYRADPDWNGTDELVITTNDHGWSSINPDDVAQTGGLEITITVNPVHDAPVATDGTDDFDRVVVFDPAGIPEDASDAENPGKTVGSLFEDLFDDARDDATENGANSGGSRSNAFIGVWVDGNFQQDGTKGFWKYYDAGSSTWVTIADGMFLGKDTLIRFEPVLNYNSESESGADRDLGDTPVLTVRLVESLDYADEHVSGDLFTDGRIYTEADLRHADGVDRFSAELIEVRLTVNAVNDAPTIGGYETGAGSSAAEPIGAVEDASVPLTDFVVGDADYSERIDGVLEATVSANHGALSLASGFTPPPGLTVAVADDGSRIVFTGSQADINAALANLMYSSSNYNNGGVSFAGLVEVTLVVSDKGGSGAMPDGTTELTAEKTVYLHVAAVNDAPSTDETDISYGSIPEDMDPALNTGKSVEDVFGGLFNDSRDNQYDATDNPGGSKSNAFIGVWVDGMVADSGKGAWQYSSDGGTTWTGITNGMFLDRTALVRFQPAQDFNSESDAGADRSLGEAPALTVRLVESTEDADSYDPAQHLLFVTGQSYTSSDFVVTETIGGVTCTSNRYSDAVNLNITVTAVNDAPVLDGYGVGATGSATDNRLTVDEDTALDIGGFTLTEVDYNETADGRLTLTIQTPNGLLNHGASGLGNRVSNSDGLLVFTGTLAEIQSILDSLTYTGKADFNGLDSVTVTVSDLGNSGEMTGGVSELTATRTIYIEVNAVPDSPVSSQDSVSFGDIVEDAGDAENPGKSVGDIFGGYFSDAKDAQNSAANPDGSEANPFIGVWVAEDQTVTDKATKGTWKYESSPGVWTEITAGMFLGVDANIRFEAVQYFNSESDSGSGRDLGAAPALKVRLVESRDATAVSDFTSGQTYADGAFIHNGTTVDRRSGEVALGIIVTAVNNAPTISGYESGTGSSASDRLPVMESDRTAIPGLSISEVDSAEKTGGTLTVTVQASNGSLSYDGVRPTGLSVTMQNNRSTMTLTGSLADINAVLGSLHYQSRNDFNGHDAIVVTVTDNGFSGAMDPGVTELTDSRTIHLLVQGVVSSPDSTADSVTFPDGVYEDIDSANNPGKTVSDLFGTIFDDSKDNQRSADNPNGSLPNAFIGIWVKGIETDSSRGVWQYNDGSGWKSVQTGMFLASDVAVRFAPGSHYNSETHFGTAGGKGAVTPLTVRLVESKETENIATCDLVTGTEYSEADLRHDSLFGGNNRFSPRDISLGITVKAVNNAPAITYTGGGQSSDSPITVDEDTSLAFTGDKLLVFDDIDVNERNGGTVSVTLTVEHGTLTLGTTAGLSGYPSGGGKTFTIKGTLADINAAIASFSYKGNANYYGADTLNITLSDNAFSGGTVDGNGVYDANAVALKANLTLHLDVLPVNDAPVITAPGTVQLPEDGSYTFGSSLRVSDVDITGPSNSHGNDYISITLTLGNAAHGSLSLGTTAGLTGTNLDQPFTTITFSGTLAEVNAALASLVFTPTADWNGNATLKVAVSDDGSAGLTPTVESAEKTVTLRVTAINDAPVDGDSGAGAVRLPAIDEDMPTAAGSASTVDDLFGARFDDTKESATGGLGENSLAGIVIVGNEATGKSSTHGTWQYYNGSTWVNIGVCSEGSALYLAANTQIRFQPARDFNGEVPKLTVRLVDNSVRDATNNPANPALVTTGGTYDLSGANATGGTTRFSAATIDLVHAVTAVNDAPVVTAPGSVSLVEDGTYTFGSALSVSDVDIGGQFTGHGNDYVEVTLTLGSAASGSLALGTTSGLSGLNLDQSFTTITFSGTQADVNAALASLVFTPTPDWNGTVTLTVKASDDGSGGAVDTTALSAEKTVTITVLPVNDAPVDGDPGAGAVRLPAIDEDTPTAAGSANTVDDLFGSRFDDTKETAAGGLGENTLAGIVIVGNGATGKSSTHGTWQYYNGTAWVDIGACSDGSALYLAANTQIRFQPARDFNGEAPALTVRLVDNSGHDAVKNPSNPALKSTGATYDLSGNNATGGTTRFSDTTIDLVHAVTAVNDAPAITAPGSVTVREDGSFAFSGTGATISVTDVEATRGEHDSPITVTLSVTDGAFRLGTVTGLTGAQADNDYATVTFTGSLADVNAALASLVYQPSPDWNGSASLIVTAADDGNSASGAGGVKTGTETVTITVLPVNDAPVDGDSGAGAVRLPAIDEDTPTAAGSASTVGDLFGTRFDDTKETATGGTGENSLAGIVIVGNDATGKATTHGTWQYYNGSTWVNIGACSDGSALYLAANTQIRFQPAPDFNGEAPKLTVRLVDNSTVDTVNNPANPALKTTGETYDLSGPGGTGGTTRFSAATIDLVHAVTAVNDAPVVTAPGSVSLVEDGTYTFGSALSVSDVDIGGQFTGHGNDYVEVTLTLGSAASGSLALGTTSGLSGLNLDQSFTTITFSGTQADVNAALASLVFTPAPDWNGTVTLIVKASDDGSGGAVDTTALSAEKTVTITVLPVNDAPVDGDPGAGAIRLPAIDEDTPTAAGSASTVNDLFGSRFDDTRETAGGGLGENTLAGVVIVGNDAFGKSSTHGTWQYYNGTAWVDIGACSDGSALFLTGTTQIRFAPAQDFNGEAPKLTVRLVDNSVRDATNNPANPDLKTTGGTYDLSGANATGGTTRFSAATIDLVHAVTAVNDAPVITAPGSVSLVEDGTYTFGSALSVSDVDIGGQFTGHGNDYVEVTLTLGSAASGSLALGTTSGLSGLNLDQSFTTITFSGTQADVNAALASLVFTPTPDWNGTVNLTVKASDDGSGGAVDTTALSAEKTVTITVLPVNDAPVDGDPGAGAIRLPAIDEDTSTAAGSSSTVNDLFGSRFDDTRETAAGGLGENSLAGVVIVGNDATGKSSTHGTWQYYNDTAWVGIGACSDGSALFLAGTTQIRFVPAQDFNGEAPKLTVRLVDDSTVDTVNNSANPALKITGETYDLSGINSTGGTTRFSEATIDLVLTVLPVNDSPSASGAVDGMLVVDIPDVVHGVSDVVTDGRTVDEIFGAAYSDARDQQQNSDNPGGSVADGMAGVLVTAVTDPDYGVWQYKDGSNWVDVTVGTVLAKDAVVRFQPGSQDIVGEGSQFLTVRYIDDSEGPVVTGTVLDDAALGVIASDQTRTDQYSEDLVRINIYLMGLNSAPTVAVDSPLNATEREPIRLAPNGVIHDAELEQEASTSWRDVSLTISRENGANADDTFNTIDPSVLGSLAEGGAVTYRGTVVGRVEANSNGTLHIVFTENANRDIVNQVLRNIGYTNVSHRPDDVVVLKYVVNDGNEDDGGRQGYGGALTGETLQTIAIAQVNELPVAVDDTADLTLEPDFSGSVTGNVLDNDYDADSGHKYFDRLLDSPRYGTLTVDGNGNFVYVADPANPDVISFRENETIEETIRYVMRDDEGGTAVATLTITIGKTPSPAVVGPVETRPEPPPPVTPPSVTPPDPTPTPIQDQTSEIRDIIDGDIPSVIADLNESAGNLWQGWDFVDPTRLAYTDDITLNGTMDGRNIYASHQQFFSLPSNIFVHKNPNERLTYMAMLPDGSPLPRWMQFNPDTLAFDCAPPEAQGTMEVVIIAKDSQNRHARAILSVNVRRADELTVANGIRDPDTIVPLGSDPAAADDAASDDGDKSAVVDGAPAQGEDADGGHNVVETGEVDDIIAFLLSEKETGEQADLPEGLEDAGQFSRRLAGIGSFGIMSETRELIHDIL